MNLSLDLYTNYPTYQARVVLQLIHHILYAYVCARTQIDDKQKPLTEMKILQSPGLRVTT